MATGSPAVAPAVNRRLRQTNTRPTRAAPAQSAEVPNSAHPAAVPRPMAPSMPRIGQAQHAARAAAPTPRSLVEPDAGFMRGRQRATRRWQARRQGTDLEGDAASVDRDGELEEGAARLLSDRESGDLGDRYVGAENAAHTAIDWPPPDDVSQHRLPLGELRPHRRRRQRAGDAWPHRDGSLRRQAHRLRRVDAAAYVITWALRSVALESRGRPLELDCERQ